MNILFIRNVLILLSLLIAPIAQIQGALPTRIKDLAEIRGVRPNQLVGFGLVIGLSGTGDSGSSLATNQAASNMLTRLGMPITDKNIVTQNIAAVIVTTNLPPFARVGDKIDIRISSIGDASSLQNGTLVMTPLQGADDQVYAVAQGPVSLRTSSSGFSQGGNVETSKTVAMVKGATVEKEFQQSFIHNGMIELSLKEADFTTSSRITQAINKKFGAFIAKPENGRLIKVTVPSSALNNPSFSPVSFVSTIEQITVNPDMKAKIIINEQTGTIIAGHNITISPVAISHGNLSIQVETKDEYIQKVKNSPNIQELVKALNAMGAGPKDLVSILHALIASGALHAELELL